jgi:hypothetical protein
MNRKSYITASAFLAILASSFSVHASGGGGGGDGGSGGAPMMFAPANTAPATFNPAEPRTGNRLDRTNPLGVSRTMQRFKDGGSVMTTKLKDGRTFLRFHTLQGSFGGYGGPPRSHIEAGFGEYLGEDENGAKRWRLTNSKGEVKIFVATADGKGTTVLGVGLTR